jgi:hypothetical protein
MSFKIDNSIKKLAQADTLIIEDPDVIKKILNHLGLWDVKRKPQPAAVI